MIEHITLAPLNDPKLFVAYIADNEHFIEEIEKVAQNCRLYLSKFDPMDYKDWRLWYTIWESALKDTTMTMFETNRGIVVTSTEVDTDVILQYRLTMPTVLYPREIQQVRYQGYIAALSPTTTLEPADTTYFQPEPAVAGKAAAKLAFDFIKGMTSRTKICW